MGGAAFSTAASLKPSPHPLPPPPSPSSSVTVSLRSANPPAPSPPAVADTRAQCRASSVISGSPALPRSAAAPPTIASSPAPAAASSIVPDTTRRRRWGEGGRECFARDDETLVRAIEKLFNTSHHLRGMGVSKKMTAVQVERAAVRAFFPPPLEEREVSENASEMERMQGGVEVAGRMGGRAARRDWAAARLWASTSKGPLRSEEEKEFNSSSVKEKREGGGW